MNEFTKMYAKLKEISLNPDSINNAGKSRKPTCLIKSDNLGKRIFNL